MTTLFKPFNVGAFRLAFNGGISEYHKTWARESANEIERCRLIIDRLREVSERDEQSDELSAALHYIQYGDEHAADECPYEDECPLGHCLGECDEGYGPCEQHKARA